MTPAIRRVKKRAGAEDFRPAEQPPMDFRQQTDATINASGKTDHPGGGRSTRLHSSSGSF
jgi:hypothetical protein